MVDAATDRVPFESGTEAVKHAALLLGARVTKLVVRFADFLFDVKLFYYDVKRAHGPPAPIQSVELLVPYGAIVKMRCPYCRMSWRHVMERWVTWRVHDMTELTRIVGLASERFEKHWEGCEARKYTAARVYDVLQGVCLLLIALSVLGAGWASRAFGAGWVGTK